MLELKTKYITRSTWPRVLQRSFICDDHLVPGFQGTVAMIRMDKVQDVLKVFSCGQSITMVDNGYFWIQIAPQNNNWWLTSMLDPDGNLLQHYFDITLENKINGDASRFVDLLLDVVALPDGTCELLDMEELEEALASQLITKQQYELALHTAKLLLLELPEKISELNRFVLTCFEVLSNRMPTVI